MEETAIPPGSPGQSQTSDAGMLMQPPEEDTYAIVLVDVRNGFNKLNHCAILWTVGHRWPSGSRFAFNCYRHSAQLVLQQTSGIPRILQSQEGVTQGDPLSMILYGIGLLPLLESLHDHVPELVQPWYENDLAISGKCLRIARALDFLMEHDSARGYYLEPAKSVLIMTHGQEDRAAQQLAQFNLVTATGYQYLGGFIGPRDDCKTWVAPQIEQWMKVVHDMAQAASRFLQSTYAGFTKSLQSEWQYLQHMVPAVGTCLSCSKLLSEESYYQHSSDQRTPLQM